MRQVSDNLNLLRLVSENPTEKWAQLVFRTLAEVLGTEIARMIDFVNPEMIVLGGEISNSGQHILDPIKEVVRKKALKIPRRYARIVATGFGPYTVSIGATALILKQFLQSEQPMKRSKLATRA